MFQIIVVFFKQPYFYGTNVCKKGGILVGSSTLKNGENVSPNVVSSTWD